MKAVLRKNNCLAAIGERLMEITDDKWNEIDGNAISDLHLALADGVLSSVAEKNTVKEIWDTLTKLYEAKSLHNKIFLKRKLYTLRMAESTIVIDHINTLKTLFSQLTMLGHNIEGNERAELLLQSLPDSYDQLIINLTNNNPVDSLVFDDVAASVLNEESRRKNKENRQASSQQAEALSVTRGRSTERGPSGSQNHGRSKSRRGSVYMGNDHALEIAGIGTIKIKMFDGTIRTIGEVRHVNGLKKNLLSLGQIDNHGCKTHVENGIMKIVKGALVLMNAEKIGANLFMLKGETLQEADACVVSNGEESTMMWHLKLGHIRCWVYPIKKKSDVFLVFKEYKARLELESSKKIKCLRTDNGGEYTDGEFLAFCKQEGIQRQFTVAYAPQQNGVAERMNRTLTEIIRAMLRTAGLPNSFWAEAAKTACYIVNRSPFTTIGLKTAMEMWTGKPADYSYLHAFGCPVYVMYNAQERTKLDPKSRRCIFLGYADGVKGYHLWDPTAHKIVISRDVIFVEDQLQRRDENDSTAKEKSETVPVYVENNPEDLNSSEAAPEHEEQEPIEFEAPEEEIEALHKNKTWELVSLPRGRKAIGNKWVYKIKRDSNDQVERYRARLVVKGYAQKEGIDFNEIFSPVVRLTTVRVVLAMLNKSLYGLKQAPRCWYKRLDSFIMSLGYNRLNSDHCAYYKRFEDNDFIILLLYVDDMLVAGPNKDRIQELKAQLAREFEMKDLGPANKILGMQIHRDRNNRKIWLLQKNYLKKILRRFNMQDLGAVSRYMANPGGEHWIAMKRILRYIRGTSDVALCYGGSEFTVRGYVDSDFAGDLDKRKSTTGYVFTLAGATVSWVSKLQTVVALSTTEAEYMAATQACKEAIWIQRLLEELGHKQEKISVFCDSQSALHIARNPVFHSRTKHIGVQYHFVREVVEDGSVDLQKIHTKENLADVLTKPINTDKFVWSRSSCGLATT
ncbi:hypothetical protein KPL71_009140 [Citrus sinensis]|uniref:Uncharacterized protein n=1 Tax=Citrus sinensis TaxID=2711 RepID=A0ACB8MBL2_CITSI|nr:hypothetical protein KPL71_009140 [Citrus sinensis]